MCAKDYKECAYINPSVKITINTPSGWHNDTTKVTVKVEDTIVSGNFTIQTVKAKVGQNGSWTDITEGYAHRDFREQHHLCAGHRPEGQDLREKPLHQVL